MSSWWQRRRERQARQEAALQLLQHEYREILQPHDPDALDTSRDWGDHDATWQAEVSIAVAALAF
jgi:hypothetical protein